MKKYEVAKRPLTINGEQHQPGDEVSLSDEDAAALIGLGRLASAKRKKPDTAE